LATLEARQPRPFSSILSHIATRPWRLVPWALAFLAAYEGQSLLAEHSLSRGMAYMCAAAVLIAIATWRFPFEQDIESDAGTDWREQVRKYAVPLGLVAVALGLGIAFRLWKLDSLPAGVWFDEATNGMIADRMLDGYRPVFLEEQATNRPALPVYFFAAGVQLLGRGILALRAVTTFAGILTLVAMFFLARELFGWRVGALSLFFLGIMRWHLNFSRIAMEPVWGPFFAVASIYFLVRGVKHGRWYDFALAGLLLGMGLQFYWAFLLVPVLFAIYTAHAFVAKRSAPFRQLAVGAFIVFIVGFVVYLPVTIYGIQNPDRYTARSSEVSITNDKDLGETIDAVQLTSKKHVLMFHSQGDPNWRHNLAGAPMLDPYTGALFVMGIAIGLTRINQPRYLLMVAWLVLLLQPAIWSVEFEAPQALRAILVTPAVAVLAALPLAALWSMVADRDNTQSEGAAP